MLTHGKKHHGGYHDHGGHGDHLDHGGHGDHHEHGGKESHHEHGGHESHHEHEEQKSHNSNEQGGKKSKHSSNPNSSSQMSFLASEESSESELNESFDLDDNIEIFEIQFAFANKELIDLLKKRGTHISHLNWEKYKVVDDEI